MKLSLRAYRVNANKTQADMAAMLKCQVKTYRKIERNPQKATLEQVEKICNYLQIPFDVKIFA